MNLQWNEIKMKNLLKIYQLKMKKQTKHTLRFLFYINLHVQCKFSV